MSNETENRKGIRIRRGEGPRKRNRTPPTGSGIRSAVSNDKHKGSLLGGRNRTQVNASIWRMQLDMAL